MITGTVPPPKVEPVQRFEDGVRVIAGHPCMEEINEPQRYVYMDAEHRWYYETQTQEIRLRRQGT
jgi:hypothetical protein